MRALIAIVLVASSPAAAQDEHAVRIAQRFDVGGVPLYLECAGTGRPILLFEAGARDGSPSWDAVWDSASGMSRACRYDRAGLGRSGGEAVESPVMGARQLEGLLTAAGIQGPYVLIAHSLGALHARMFAHRNPAHVVGVVLVDGLHERQRTRVLALPFPADSADAAAWSGYVNEQRRRQRRTLDGVDSLVVEMAGRTLGTLPLIVISAGRPIGTPPPGFPIRMARSMEQVWLEGQRELVGLSPRGRHVVVDGAGHYVHRERPGVVLAAMREILELARAGRRR